MAKFGSIMSSSNMPNGAASAISATPGSTVTLDVTTGNHAVWTAGENETVNASGAQFASQELTCIITNDATLPRTITFGTGFKPSATVVGTVSKVAVIKFVSNGTDFYELARTLALG